MGTHGPSSLFVYYSIILLLRIGGITGAQVSASHIIQLILADVSTFNEAQFVNDDRLVQVFNTTSNVTNYHSWARNQVNPNPVFVRQNNDVGMPVIILSKQNDGTLEFEKDAYIVLLKTSDPLYEGNALYFVNIAYYRYLDFGIRLNDCGANRWCT